jgi:hypothetical protein
MPGKLGSEKSTTNKATRSPTIRDLAWAAGFIEGEGSFPSTGNIFVSQVNPDPLVRLLEMFGGTVRRINNQAIWRWVVSGSRARGIMLTLYPLMSDERKRQIKKAIKNAA